MNKHEGCKIFLVNRFFFPDHSATSQLLTDLAFFLSDKGFKVTVICSHQTYDNLKSLLPKNEVINNVNIYRIKTSNFGRHWLPGRILDYASYFMGMSWKLLTLLKPGNIVVVKTDPPLTSVISLPISKIKGAHHINWVQDLFPEVAVAIGLKGVPRLAVSLTTFLRNWSFRYSTRTVVIGNVMKKKLAEQGLADSLLRIIPNWSDAINIAPLSHIDNPLKKSWKLSGKFVVAYSGNMGRVHEFDTIIHAAKELEEWHDIVFLFIGGGPQKSYIEKKIENLGVKNVSFIPYQPYDSLKYSLTLPDIHLISLKSEIEGYCVPSKYYGIIAAGRASIFIGDVEGEIASLVDAEKTGVVIKEGDFHFLAKTIFELSKEPERLARYGANARKSLDDKYEKKLALNRWLVVIDEVFKEI